MKTSRTLHYSAVLASITLLGNLSAAVIAAWDVNGVELDRVGASGIDGDSTSSPYTFSAGTTAMDLQSAKLSLSSSVNSSTAIDSYGFKVATATTSLAGAIGSDHYIEFELQPKPGFLINLVSLEMYGGSTGTGANNLAVLSSVDGFSDTNAIASVVNIAGVTGGFDTDASGFGGPISLSDSKFQKLTAITFRIYGWNTSSSTGATSIRDLGGNDLIINGSLSGVPEPTSWVPVGALICSSMLLRVRTKE